MISNIYKHYIHRRYMDEKLILKVQFNKASKQKFINIPKGCTIREGDYALIKKVLDNNK